MFVYLEPSNLPRRTDMPTVGKKKFPYTKKGKAAAKKAAAKSGKPMKKKKGY